MPVFANNKDAKRNYQSLDTFEAGIVLHGHEVKSIKNGNVNLKGSYVSLDQNNEAWIHNMHIAPYTKASQLDHHDPYRKRKLLLKKEELVKIIGTLAQKGLTLVPFSLYSKGNKIKVEVALVKGKKKADKREDLKKRDIQRDLERQFKLR